jgi:hypothetical protein
VGWFCGALGPKEFDPFQPLAKCLPETHVPGIGRSAQLGLQSLRAEEGYADGDCLHSPASPDNPDVEVEQPRRVGQTGYNLALDWNWVLIDFLVEALAQRNDVVGLLMRWRFLLIFAVEPKPHPIKKMKPLADGRRPPEKTFRSGDDGPTARLAAGVRGARTGRKAERGMPALASRTHAVHAQVESYRVASPSAL